MDKQRRKRVNFITKAVSILLIVVMMIVFLPETMTVLAEEIKSAGGESEQSQQVEQEQESTYEPDFSVEDMHSTPAEQEEAYILYEAEYKRSEYEKHFYMSDGTYMRETYAMPIHYLDDDGLYKEIENANSSAGNMSRAYIENTRDYYVEEWGVEGTYNPYSYDGGDYSIYVKPQTLSCTVEIPYISLQAPSAAMAVTAYYNPGFSALRRKLMQGVSGMDNTQDYYGEDIKLNIEQYMVPLYERYAENGTINERIVGYLYVDADGSVHNFLPTSDEENNTEYYNVMLGYTYNSTDRKMLDGTGFAFMSFDSLGRLIDIYTKNGDNIGIIYYQNNQINCIKNRINGYDYQIINFEYNTSNKLAEMYGAFQIVPIGDDLDYVYEKAHRVQLTYLDNKLMSVKDINDEQLVKIMYELGTDFVDIYNRYGAGH
ncbi:MAG: hypothetical protein E7350_00435, partial [Clostridiales bacterium]|nr:hypothetical protein [Clostridiales bacterium]